jgi:hypothetical protein
VAPPRVMVYGWRPSGERMSPSRLVVVVMVLLALAGCGTTAQWHAGAFPGATDFSFATTSPVGSDVAVFFKPDFGACEETESETRVMCGSTTLLRKIFLLAGEDTPAPPDRDWDVVGHVTTEEFPRDEATSRIITDQVTNAFGIGPSVFDTFQVQLDPAFREQAIDRLRAWAARLGADAVIDVFATGEAEHHMWHGTVISFWPQSPHSPIYSAVRLLDLRLRDVRLHGTAIRYED